MLLYLVANLGISISAHYCADELASWSLIDDSGNLCPCNNKPMKKDCCEDKKVVLKSTTDQRDAPFEPFDCSKCFAGDAIVNAVFPHSPKVLVSGYLQADHYALFHPPPLRQLPIYLLNGRLLI